MKNSTVVDIDSGVKLPAGGTVDAVWHGYSSVASERVKVLKYIPEASVMCAGTILPTVFAFDVDTTEGLWSVTSPGVFGAIRALDIRKRVLVCGFDDCAIRVFIFATVASNERSDVVDYRSAPLPGVVLLNAHLDYIRCCTFQPSASAWVGSSKAQQRGGGDNGGNALPPMMLSASDDQTVRAFAWEGPAENPQLKQVRIMTGHVHYVMAVAWLPEPPLADRGGGAAVGRCAISCSLDASVRLWDVLSGALLASCSDLHGKRGINQVVVHPASYDAERNNTKWIAATGGDDCSVTLLRIERAATGSMILYVVSRHTTHQRFVTAVLFRPSPAEPKATWPEHLELLSASEDGFMHTYALPMDGDDVAQGDVVCSKQPLPSLDGEALSRQWSLCTVGTQNRIAIGHDKGVYVVTDAETRAVARHGRAPTAFVSIPDGGVVVHHSALHADNSGAVAAACTKRGLVRWVHDDRRGTYTYLAVCIAFILANVVLVYHRLFAMEASGARVQWSDVLLVPWWNWLLMAAAMPFLCHIVMDMTPTSTIDLELEQRDEKEPWAATVNLSWTTVSSAMLRRRHDGAIRFRVDCTVKFFGSPIASGVTVEVPCANVDYADLDAKRFYVNAAKEGVVCACGGQHKLVDRYRLPFVQRRWFSSTTFSRNLVAQRERMQHLQWTTLANAIGQQSNSTIAFLGLDG